MHETSNEALDVLSHLIGREAVVEQRHLRVIEVLRDGPSLILSHLEDESSLQESLYGEARRRTAKTFQVPVRSEVGERMHPVAQAFLSTDEQALLLKILFKTR